MINILTIVTLLTLVGLKNKHVDSIDLQRPKVQNVTSNQSRLNQPNQLENNLWAHFGAYTTCENPNLGLAITQIESDFNNVRTIEGSLGLMQVQLNTARWIGCDIKNEQDLMDPIKNVKCGCKFLNHLSKKYKKMSDVVASYNAGSPRLCRTGHLRPSGRTCVVGKYINQSYVDKVLSAYEVYNQPKVKKATRIY